MNDIKVESPSGKRMFGYISPIYDNSRIMKLIFERNGREIDDLHGWIPDIQKQFFIQTATWGLRYWEELVGIPVNENDSYHLRRSRLIAKIQQRWPMTVERMRQITSSAADNIEVEIDQNVADYTFQVLFKDDERNLLLAGIVELIDDVKPAHLAYQICAERSTTIQLQIGYERYAFPYPICNTLYCGTWPSEAVLGRAAKAIVKLQTEYKPIYHLYPICGTICASNIRFIDYPYTDFIGYKSSIALETTALYSVQKYPECNTIMPGEYPMEQFIGKLIQINLVTNASEYASEKNYNFCGTCNAGEVVV